MCAMLDIVYEDKRRLSRDELVEHARRAGLSDERVRGTREGRGAGR
jgi:hypothetical protein